ncbi:MAG: hypothetical protein ABR529_09460 [Actinomycetota bacterium]
MTLGLGERQTDLLDDAKRFCDDAVDPASIYALLHRERDQLFPDEMFEDLFTTRGRRSIPPSIVATVMVLQRTRAARTERRWTASPLICAGNTQPGLVLLLILAEL